MKKLVLTLVALAAAPAIASEPVELAGLGLAAMQEVSEQDGLRVRGLSAASASLSVASMSGLLFDPVSGDQVNIDMSQLTTSSGQMTGNEGSSAGGEAAVGFTGMAFDVNDFSATLGQSALFAGGQTAANGSFNISSLNVPSFSNSN